MATVPQQRYTRVAVVLHWTIAALIALNLAIGWFMEDLVEPYRTIVVRLHQSSGMTVLALTVARIAWRLTHRPPPFDPRVSPAERRTAGAVHVILYIAMLAIPLSGWALISANPPRYETPAVTASPSASASASASAPQRKYIMIWGIIPLYPIAPIQAIASEPGGIARQHLLHERIVGAHEVAGYGLLALLVLHILAALKHQLLDRQAALSRMSIGRARPGRGGGPRDRDAQATMP